MARAPPVGHLNIVCTLQFFTLEPAFASSPPRQSVNMGKVRILEHGAAEVATISFSRIPFIPRLATAVGLCVLIASLGGCSRPSSTIVGKWQVLTATNGSAYEFFKDGSAMLRGRDTTLNGTWRFLDDGRLRVETTVGGSVTAEVYKVTFGRETATFRDSRGNVQQFEQGQGVCVACSDGHEDGGRTICGCADASNTDRSSTTSGGN